MDETRKTARIAGFLYFVTLVLGPVGLIYVPGKIIVSGDAKATADHIRASAQLLRVGIACEFFAQVALIYAVLVLYRLFKAIDEAMARQMLVLGALVSAPILFVNLLNEFAAQMFAGEAWLIADFERHQLDGLALFFMQLHGKAYAIAELFWGLWLFPFGALVVRCGFLPRVLGWLLWLAGAGYVADCVTWLLFPEFSGAIGAAARWLELGELPIILWLLVVGARTRASSSATT